MSIWLRTVTLFCGKSPNVSSIVSAVNKSQLLWHCNITNDIPDSQSMSIGALIDTGASIILVRDTMVKELNLPLNRLEKPLSIMTATNTKKCLIHSVNIVLSSLDCNYIAKLFTAVVSDTLSNDVILDMPFLEANSIIVDMHNGIVKDVVNDYTLLHLHNTRHPGDKHRKMQKPHERRLMTQKYQNSLLAELKHCLAITKKTMDLHHSVNETQSVFVISQIASRIESIEEMERLDQERQQILNEFDSVFDTVPHADDLPTDVLAEIKLKDTNQMIKTRTYTCPRKYRQAWQTLIQQYLDAGRIRPSSASQASPAFIIPKADPSALPRWVNDYRQLNKNTIPDKYPLPCIDNILADCGKGKIWGTIDMTNAFFQTKMKPSDVPLTAVSTPFGLYKWCVMPMGLRNAPAIHQQHVNMALHKFIGKICHIYLDDIVTWSNTVEEHRNHVRLILDALHTAGLYCNLKKTKLFQREINFLGHTINNKGIFADEKKVERITNWPVPSSAKDVHQSLGLVCYLASFLPQLA
jgi:hypothetical protein